MTFSRRRFCHEGDWQGVTIRLARHHGVGFRRRLAADHVGLGGAVMDETTTLGWLYLGYALCIAAAFILSGVRLR